MIGSGSARTGTSYDVWSMSVSTEYKLSSEVNGLVAQLMPKHESDSERSGWEKLEHPVKKEVGPDPQPCWDRRRSRGGKRCMEEVLARSGQGGTVRLDEYGSFVSTTSEPDSDLSILVVLFVCRFLSCFVFDAATMATVDMEVVDFFKPRARLLPPSHPPKPPAIKKKRTFARGFVPPGCNYEDDGELPTVEQPLSRLPTDTAAAKPSKSVTARHNSNGQVSNDRGMPNDQTEQEPAYQAKNGGSGNTHGKLPVSLGVYISFWQYMETAY
jgi:hypothetical protein